MSTIHICVTVVAWIATIFGSFALGKSRKCWTCSAYRANEPTKLRSDGPRTWCPSCGERGSNERIGDDGKTFETMEVTFVLNNGKPYIRCDCLACGATWNDDVSESAEYVPENQEEVRNEGDESVRHG